MISSEKEQFGGKNKTDLFFVKKKLYLKHRQTPKREEGRYGGPVAL